MIGPLDSIVIQSHPLGSQLWTLDQWQEDTHSTTINHRQFCVGSQTHARSDKNNNLKNSRSRTRLEMVQKVFFNNLPFKCVPICSEWAKKDYGGGNCCGDPQGTRIVHFAKTEKKVNK